MLQAGCAIDLTQAVLAANDPTANGFAAIRPPGHHASQDKACGFCLFNNVAICAKKVGLQIISVLFCWFRQLSPASNAS